MEVPQRVGNNLFLCQVECLEVRVRLNAFIASEKQRMLGEFTGVFADEGNAGFVWFAHHLVVDDIVKMGNGRKKALQFVRQGFHRRGNAMPGGRIGIRG